MLDQDQFPASGSTGNPQPAPRRKRRGHPRLDKHSCDWPPAYVPVRDDPKEPKKE